MLRGVIWQKSWLCHLCICCKILVFLAQLPGFFFALKSYNNIRIKVILFQWKKTPNWNQVIKNCMLFLGRNTYSYCLCKANLGEESLVCWSILASVKDANLCESILYLKQTPSVVHWAPQPHFFHTKSSLAWMLIRALLSPVTTLLLQLLPSPPTSSPQTLHCSVACLKFPPAHHKHKNPLCQQCVYFTACKFHLPQNVFSKSNITNTLPNLITKCYLALF